MISHALSLIQQRARNFLLVQSPTRLGWADKELMNEEGRQSGSQKKDRGQLLTPLYCWVPLPREAMGQRGRAGAGGTLVSTCCGSRSGRGPSGGQLGLSLFPALSPSHQAGAERDQHVVGQNPRRRPQPGPPDGGDPTEPSAQASGTLSTR